MSETLPGPLNNPDWTDEQNRKFDQTDRTRGLPAAEIVRDLGIKEPSPKRKVKPVYGAIQKGIADAGINDQRILAAREQTEGGGAILDMDPTKKAYDLEQIRKIRDNLEKGSSQEPSEAQRPFRIKRNYQIENSK